MNVRSLAVVLASGLAIAIALPLAASAGPTPGGVDTDGDTVEDAFDNCRTTANATQVDTDRNGCGDVCTQDVSGDSNGDLVVGAPDFLALGMQFGNTGCGSPNPPCSADFNGDTTVGAPDFLILGMTFGNTVGPSGISNAQCDPTTCRCPQ
jgi:hypothetical protein